MAEPVSDEPWLRERLRRSEQAGRFAFWEWDVLEDRITWSRHTASLFGIEHAPASYEAFAALIHPEDRARVHAEVQGYLAEGGPFEHEFRVIGQDGQVRWILDRGEMTLGPDGQPLLMFGINIDLTPQRQTEAALRLSEKRLRLAQEVAGVGTFEWNIKDNINRWSPEIERLYGLPEGGFGGTYEAWAQRVHPDDLADAEACVRKALETGEFDAEWRIVRPNGDILWVQARAIVEKDAAGRPIRMIGANFDITERKEAEERQALLTREIDHRAKNALAVVQSVVRLTRAHNPDDFVAAVEGRIRAIAHAHTLLAESGWKSVRLRRLLKHELAVHGLERMALTGEDVVLEPQAAQPFALAVHELATNAAKYGALSATPGRIEVSWSVDPAQGVRMIWRETGGPRVEPPAHKGFGTTLVATAVERQLGGAVRYEWNPTGLVCELLIPLERVRGQVPRARGDARASRRKARVLVVEDDTLIALDVAASLEEIGYEVVGPVGNVASALEMVGNGVIDAVVLDANLGGDSAAPVAERLRRLGIPFVIATGYDATLGFEAAEGAPILTKPIAAEDLRRTVGALLD